MKPFKTIVLSVLLLTIFRISLAQVYTDEVQVVEGLNGNVGIGAPSAGARLSIDSPHGNSLYISAPSTILHYSDHSLTLQAKSHATFVPYIEWRTATGARQAYLGWTSSHFNLTLDNNYNFGIMGGKVGIV